MVDAGTFREDLFYRVNVVNLEVPSLRDRPEDISTLARHMLQKYAREYGKVVRDIEPDAMDLLMTYEWPGNVRELENVIQRSLILADGTSIGVSELPDEWTEAASQAVHPLSGDSIERGSFEEIMRDFKVKLARNAVLENGGNKSLAAKQLNISRAYLHILIRNGPQLVSAA
jgi:transcriptional regulator with PAS, ATPase and Fis domain